MIQFPEEIFIWALVTRTEDAKKFSVSFQPEWLHTSEYIPVLAEIYSFITKSGTTPSLKTLHRLFKDKDEEAYNARYKGVLDKLAKQNPDISEVIYTLDKAKDVAQIRSFQELMADPAFLRQQADFKGDDLSKSIMRWMNKFQGGEENKSANIKEAIEELVQSQGFTSKQTKIPTGISIIDKWCGGGLRTKQLGILMAPTGEGKTFSPKTPILMYDGSIKQARNIQINDLVMGPDSNPRTIIDIHSGFGEMYKITPIKGNPFICNKRHTLSLRSTKGTKGYYQDDEIVNVDLDKYLNFSKSRKHVLKLWRTGIEFPSENLNVDPYIVGAYLGDGDKKGCRLSLGNKKQEVLEYFIRWGNQNFLTIKKHYDLNNNVAASVSSKDQHKNFFRTFVRNELIKNDQRNIPKNYLINSEKNRLQLLAGLLDTDGCLNHNSYEIVQKDKQLADQIVFLARSLGFGTSIKKCTKTIKSIGFSGTYYRMYICGDTCRIPCKVSHKIAKERRQKKNPLRTGFKVEQIENGPYFGFELDGDHLHLLGDFTVSHNSAVLTVMGHKAASVYNTKTWVVTNELPLSEVTERYLTRMTGTPLDLIMDDPTVVYKDKKLQFHWKRGLQDRIRITDITRPPISTDDLEAEMMRWVNLSGWKPQLMILDHMERMKPNPVWNVRKSDEWSWLGTIATDLCNLAKRHNILVWSACQTNRPGMEADRLTLAHGQSSIRHFQEATVVIGLKQTKIPGVKDRVGLTFSSLKMRQAKSTKETVTLEADLSRMSITTKEIESVSIEREDKKQNATTPRQQQQKYKR